MGSRRVCTRRVTISISTGPFSPSRTVKWAHAFVVMLAYQIIRYLVSCWSAFDVTVAEGLHALTTLCLVEVSPQQAPSYHCIPTPRDAIARLLHSADITLPKAFALSGVRVSTRKKLQSERLPQ